MAGLKTKGVVKQGGFIKKEIQPGNRTARVHEISLVRPSYAKDGEEMYDIVMVLETPPIEGEFEGFDKVFGDPSKGKFKGQSAKVKGSEYSMKTTVSKKDGKEWTVEEKVMGFLLRLSTEMGNPGWLDSMDGKVNSLDELVKEFNRVKEFKTVYLNWCIGGQEKIKDGKYVSYYLHLPFNSCPVPFANPNGNSEVSEFNKDVHVKKDKNAVESSNLNNAVVEDEDEENEFASGASIDDEPFEIDDDSFSIDDDEE